MSKNITILGNANNVQIQQGTVNGSSQNIEANESNFDYAKASEAIQQILKFESMFYSEFGDYANEAIEILKSVQFSIEKKEEPSVIKKLSSKAKSFFSGIGKGTTISVLSGVILNLLSNLGA